jgi:hypothetical protein
MLSCANRPLRAWCRRSINAVLRRANVGSHCIPFHKPPFRESAINCACPLFASNRKSRSLVRTSEKCQQQTSRPTQFPTGSRARTWDGKLPRLLALEGAVDVVKQLSGTLLERWRRHSAPSPISQAPATHWPPEVSTARHLARSRPRSRSIRKPKAAPGQSLVA